MAHLLHFAVLVLFLTVATATDTSGNDSQPLQVLGADVVLEQHSELSNEQTNQLLERIRISLHELGFANETMGRHAQRAPVTFQTPLFKRFPGFVTDPDPYWVITNYVDNNPTCGQRRDYNCGTRTYDRPDGSGCYNHRGTDFVLYPFPWRKFYNNEIHVVAAAPGTIITKEDFHDDRHCSPSGDWNIVSIKHSDNSIAWYGHLKKESATSKTVGQTVTAGEFLGLVGSSGQSDVPHLHFELYDYNSLLRTFTLVDPFKGSCNNIPQSRWQSQIPYNDMAVSAMITSIVPQTWPPCPQAEPDVLRTTYYGTPTIYFTMHIKNWGPNFPIVSEVIRPDGTVRNRWTRTLSSFSLARWEAQTWTFTSADPLGTYHYTTTLNGRKRTKSFTLALLT